MSEPDEKLVALFKSVGMKDFQELAKMIAAKKCRTVAILSEWRDEPKELKSLLTGTKWESDDETFPLLKLAFKQAIEDTTRDRKRKSMGIDEDAESTLLSEEASTAMLSKYRSKYNVLDIDSRKILCDQQTSKIKKEFDRSNPQFMALGALQTQAQARSRKATKSERFSSDITMVFNAPADTEKGGALDLVSMGDAFRSLAFTWSIAGCFDYAYTPSGATAEVTVLYVHQSQAFAYVFEFTFRANELRIEYTEWSVARYIIATEERFRRKAMDLAKGQGMSAIKWPFGLALLHVLETQGTFWQTDFHMLKKLEVRPKGKNKEGKGSDGHWDPPPPQTWKETPAPSTKGGRKGKKTVTSKVTHKGEPICEPFNDQRSCQKSDCGGKHVCNGVLMSGKSCEGNHRRIHHDAKKHGGELKRDS